MKAKKNIDLGFASVALEDQYVISTINEGVTFGAEELDTIFEVFNTYYKDKAFVSIANRKNDYTIKPDLLRKNHPDLIGIGVVCYTESSRKIAAFEKNFYKGTFEIFDSLEAAKTWAVELLKTHKKAGL